MQTLSLYISQARAEARFLVYIYVVPPGAASTLFLYHGPPHQLLYIKQIAIKWALDITSDVGSRVDGDGWIY